MLHKAFAREVARNQYEATDDGRIYLAKSKVYIGGIFTHEVIRDGESLRVGRNHNIVVAEGRTHLLNVLLAGATQVSPWYLGLFKGNYTPVDGDKATNIVANATECQTEYDESARPTFVGSVTGDTGSNDGSKATFTFNATVTIYGAFLISVNTKGSTTGTLFSAGRFEDGQRDMKNTDKLQVGYNLQANDA